MMTGVRVQIRNEWLSIAIKVLCRLLEDAFALAVTDDVVFFACDCLPLLASLSSRFERSGLPEQGHRSH